MLWFNDKSTTTMRRERLFRYDASWDLEEECDNIVRNSWMSTKTTIGSIDRIHNCLSKCGKALTRWSKHNEKHKNKDIEYKYAQLKLLQDEQDGSNMAKIKKPQEELMFYLNKISHRGSLPKDIGIKNNINTRYFHVCASQRKRKNTITQIIDSSNSTFTKDEDIEDAFKNYFESIFISSKLFVAAIKECLRTVDMKMTATMNASFKNIGVQWEMRQSV